MSLVMVVIYDWILTFRKWWWKWLAFMIYVWVYVCAHICAWCSNQPVNFYCVPYEITSPVFSFSSFILILTLVMGTLNTFSQVKEPEPFLWLMTNQGTFMPRRHWTEKREPSTHWWLRRWTGTLTGHWNHHQNLLSRSRTLMTTLRSFCMKPIMPMCLRGPMWVCKLGSLAPLVAGFFAGTGWSCPPSSEPEPVLKLYCILTRKNYLIRFFLLLKIAIFLT